MAEDSKGFVIKDRRLSNQDSQESDALKNEDASEETEAETKDKKSEEQIPLPEINFSVFVFSLNSSALVQLGLLEDPAIGKKIKNLPIARQTIDILGMLEEKTKGNLSKDEEGLLKNLLYDLRILYVREKG